MLFLKTTAVLVLAAGLAACGGGKNASQTAANTNSAGTVADRAAGAPMGGTDSSGNAMAPGTLATVPPNVQCGAVAPVWVNTRTHVYHLSSDPMYGRTKYGVYKCPSAAKAEGDRPAGGAMKSRHHKADSMQNSSGT